MSLPPWALAAGRVLAALAVVPLLGAGALFGLQRRLVFPAPPPAALPPGAGLLVSGTTPRGQRIAALWAERRPGDPVVAYFHGNAMQLADCAALVPLVHAAGWSLFAVEYPGYGPLAGAGDPSETSLREAASAAMALLRTQLSVPASRTVLLGQSLGTGVALGLAAEGEGAGLVLLSPYRSIGAVAAEHLSVPGVRWLVRDGFEAEGRARRVRVPAVVVHGARDAVIPVAHGRQVAAWLPQGRLVVLPEAGHNDLWSDHADAVRNALEAVRPGP